MVNFSGCITIFFFFYEKKKKNVAFCVVLDSSKTLSRCKLDSYKRTGIGKEAYFKIQ